MTAMTTTALAPNTVRPSQLRALLMACIPAHEPLLITGQPAIGKSAIVEQACAAVSAQLLILHPVISDPTDFKGLPFMIQDGAEFLPFGDLRKLINATQLTVCFIDDIGQAPMSVQGALMQLVHARRIGEHKVSPHVVFIGATNRKSDRAGVTGMIEPLKSRWISIVELIADLDEWRSWAVHAGICPEVIAYLNLKPEYLAAFKPSADMINSPSPRTWEAVSRQITKLQLPPDILLPTINGAIGFDVGIEFVGFMRIWRDMVNPSVILASPDNAPIPTNPSALAAVATALALQVQEQALGRYERYLIRLMDAHKNEFVAISMRTVMSRPDATQLSNTAGMIKIHAGPIGQLMNGGRTL